MFVSSLRAYARHVLLLAVLLASLFPAAALSSSALAAPAQATQGTSASSPSGPQAVNAKRGQQGNAKTVICHRTGSAKNPFVRIVVASAAAVTGHMAHPGDIIGPAGDENFQCPTNTPKPDTGTLKICKVLAAGSTAPAGTLFTFTAGNRTVSVAPGTCVLIPDVAVGSVRVTETGANGFLVVNIRTLAGVCTPTGANVGNATTCTIVKGQTTEVEFTNKEQNRGALKICKDLAAGSTAPAGTLFTFTVAGRTVSVAPGTCVLIENVPVGSVVVTETGPAGFEVVEIRTLAGTCTPTGANVGNATTCTIVMNRTTEVLFINRMKKAFIQICKETEGGLTGTFSFTSPAFAGTRDITVVAGATQPVCAPLIEVNAGSIAVTELAAGDTVLASVRTVPAGRCTLTNRTATCTIPAGGPSEQTQIIFRNRNRH